MKSREKTGKKPLLFRYLESEKIPKKSTSPRSNPIEEEPTPEPTKKTPWGD